MLELCDGTLDEVINGNYKGAPLPPDREVLYQIADGLHHIHKNNIKHWNIQPNNILISKDSIIKISGFSFCKETTEWEGIILPAPLFAVWGRSTDLPVYSCTWSPVNGSWYDRSITDSQRRLYDPSYSPECRACHLTARRNLIRFPTWLQPG